jgi:hypothetical protein
MPLEYVAPLSDDQVVSSPSWPADRSGPAGDQDGQAVELHHKAGQNPSRGDERRLDFTVGSQLGGDISAGRLK